MRRDASTTPSRSNTLTRGLLALTKSALLVLGVPIAATRLWQFSSDQSYSLHIGLIIDLVLGLVGVFWIFAVFQLLGEVLRTMHTPDTTEHSSWSSSWAAGIVGLLLLAGGLSMHGSSQRNPAAVVRIIHAEVQHLAPKHSLRNRNAIAPKVALGLGALIGAALLGRTRQLGHLRLSLRLPGGAPEEPSGEVQDLVRELAGVASERMIDWVEAINRLLGSLFLVDELPDAPEIALFRVGEEGIEILLHQPRSDPPAPFYASEQGFWWRIEEGITLDALRNLGKTAPRYLPPLIPVGNDGSGEILVCVNPGKILGICGENSFVDAALDACLTAVRVLPWCDELAVEMVGMEPPPLDQQSVHMQRSNLETLLMLRDRPISSRVNLLGSWQREPLVIMNRNALNGPTRDSLISAARRHGAIIAGISGEITLTVKDEGAELAPYGIKLRSHLLQPLEVSLVDRLLQAYAQPLNVISLRTAEQIEQQTTDIEITILGESVEIIGAQRQPHPEDNPRVQELLVFLCLHNYRSSIAKIRDEIFVDLDELTLRRRVDNLIATTRATLGRSQNGSEHLWLNEQGLVELSRSVTLDWFELEKKISKARGVEGSQAIKLLDASLRTIPSAHLLGTVTLYPWFQAMRYGEYIKATLVDACHHLVSLAQDSDQTEVVRAALTLGHEIEPGSEIIARDLMVIADQHGDRETIERVFRNLQMALEHLGGAEPSALTNRLFHSLISAPNATER